ncbi:MAG: ABC transporter permease [Phycisphaerales bacterium]
MPALRKATPAITLALTVLAFAAIAPGRLSITDARIVLLQTAIVGIVGLGMAVVIVGGGIDLSIGSLVALCGVVAARVLAADLGVVNETAAAPMLAVAAALFVGTLAGLYNGVLIAILRLPPFIVTLGTLGFFRGLAKWACGGGSQVGAPPGWLASWVRLVPRPAWLLVAPTAWLLLGLSGLAAAWLHWSVAGRQLIATGASEEAARRAGIPIHRRRIASYAICGTLGGLAGVIQFARLGGMGDPTIQVGLELRAIAAVVIGGASLAGGHVSIAGTLCGALLMAFLDNRAASLGWPNYVQELIVGHIIILAVALDRWRPRA